MSLTEVYPWLEYVLGELYEKTINMTTMHVTLIHGIFYEEFKYSSLGTGAYRQVYDVGNDWVIKFPVNANGIECNLIENKIYELFGDTEHYAKCHIKLYQGIPILWMEKVKPYLGFYNDTGKLEELPKWAHHQDGPQVGTTKDNKLVIYDYGGCTDELQYWWNTRGGGNPSNQINYMYPHVMKDYKKYLTDEE